MPWACHGRVRKKQIGLMKVSPAGEHKPSRQRFRNKASRARSGAEDESFVVARLAKLATLAGRRQMAKNFTLPPPYYGSDK
jgi:hypothetical protein